MLQISALAMSVWPLPHRTRLALTRIDVCSHALRVWLGSQKKGNATVDGRNPAPPKKPRNDDPPVNANKHWFPMGSIWCRIPSIHSTTLPEHIQLRIRHVKSMSLVIGTH